MLTREPLEGRAPRAGQVRTRIGFDCWCSALRTLALIYPSVGFELSTLHDSAKMTVVVAAHQIAQTDCRSIDDSRRKLQFSVGACVCIHQARHA